MSPSEKLNPNWMTATMTAVVQAILANVKKYDEATLTWGELVNRIEQDVEMTITRTYDHGFDHGITAQVEEEDDEDSQLEFDLDELREIGDEGEEIDEEE